MECRAKGKTVEADGMKVCQLLREDLTWSHCDICTAAVAAEAAVRNGDIDGGRTVEEEHIYVSTCWERALYRHRDSRHTVSSSSFRREQALRRCLYQSSIKRKKKGLLSSLLTRW